MPKLQALPTWLAWNNCDFTSPTGITDMATGQPIGAGGLNLGDYFDATNEEAANSSYTNNGLLFSGRYRLVQVDSGATAANVKTGTVGYIAAGKSVKSVAVLTAGSGQTPGVYTITATAGSGGGSGAIIQVIVSAAGTVTARPTVLQGGFNYTSVPTFTMPSSAGGTGATFVAQLNTTPNRVTSYDQVGVSGLGASGFVRPVVFLNSITPGNYGFIQELGTATVLSGAVNQVAGQFANTTTGGVMAVSATSVSINTIGQVIDALTSPLAGTPFKIEMGITATVVQD